MVATCESGLSPRGIGGESFNHMDPGSSNDGTSDLTKVVRWLLLGLKEIVGFVEALAAARN